MTTDRQQEYLPQEFGKLFLGMTLEQFRQMKDVSKMDVDENEFVSYYSELVDSNQVQEYIFQFDKNKILYEMIIEFKPEYDVNAFIRKLYGKPNNGEEWVFGNENDEFKIKIWRFMNNFCVANANYFD
jgi:hypothetical protein